MNLLITGDSFFVERTGKPFQKCRVNLQGEFDMIEKNPMLSDLVFKERDNFYTHHQDTIKYWTIGVDKIIMVQEFKALHENHGFHGVHDRLQRQEYYK